MVSGLCDNIGVRARGQQGVYEEGIELLGTVTDPLHQFKSINTEHNYDHVNFDAAFLFACVTDSL
ncbi:MAG: hypothetical protein OSB46_07860 [Alphaproteobacteria bacterium]|nr:hypothetical protein [Alphaproteobacteria bacterium]